MMAISGIESLRQLGLLSKANFKAAKSLTTSASKSDCQRLSRMLLLSGIERKRSEVPFESPTMMRFQEENDALNSNLDCNQTINQFGVE